MVGIVDIYNIGIVDIVDTVDTVDFVDIVDIVNIVDIVAFFTLLAILTLLTLFILLKQSGTKLGCNWNNLKNVSHIINLKPQLCSLEEQFFKVDVFLVLGGTSGAHF